MRIRPARRVSSSIRGAAKFSDPRVRKALDYAFDYEFANKNLFYGLYKRTNSYFENSDMKATGKPSPEELALLEPFRAKLPAAVFEAPYVSPVSDGSGTDRKLLREAARLLDEAGCKIKDRVRVCPSGDALEIEFLMYEGSFERIIAPYVKNLQAIGVAATMRLVDSAQYQRRVKSFDFDVVTQRFVLRLTPGIEMRNYWGSETASYGRQPQSGRHQGSGHRCADRQGRRCQEPGGTRDRDARYRSRSARRPLLGAAVVQGGPSHRLLGQVLVPGDETQV